MPDDICAGIPDCDKDGQTDGGKGLGFFNSKKQIVYLNTNVVGRA